MESLFWSLMRSLGRGRLTRIDDAGAVQLVQMQLSQSEVRDKTPRLAEYGFSSHPPVGADAVAVFLGGDRTNGFVIACNHQQYRVRGLASGEVCVSDDKGQSVLLSAAGIVVNGGGLPVTVTNTPSVTVDTPHLHCTGNITSGQSITAAQDVADAGGAKTMAGMRQSFDTHRHPVPGVEGGDTTVTSDTPDTPQ